ncbi:MAG: hypothetical protein AABZ47_08140 [Planctomycetota bacterium]
MCSGRLKARLRHAGLSKKELQNWVDQLVQVPPVRLEKVRLVRQALQVGGYELRSKIDPALDGMQNELST